MVIFSKCIGSVKQQNLNQNFQIILFFYIVFVYVVFFDFILNVIEYNNNFIIIIILINIS
jgi:hypothetical protein